MSPRRDKRRGRAAALLLPLLAGTALTACGEDVCAPEQGQICTAIGTGTAGFNGDGKAARATELYLPLDVTVGPDKRLYLVDFNNHRVRALDALTGLVQTIAGTGLLGDGPPGPALQADFNHPTNLIFDRLGRLVIAAWHNSRIKRVDLATGLLEDICGTGKRAYSGDGGPAEVADLDLPASLALDPLGNMIVMDQANQVLRKIDGDGVITRFAGRCITTTCAPGEDPVACPGTDKLACGADLVEACTKPCQGAYGGDDGPALEARMNQPFGQAADPAGRIGFDAAGNLYFADTQNHRVRKIDPSGIVTTVAGTGTAGTAGDGGPATQAQLSGPTDLAFAPDGTIYIADTQNSCVRALAPAGTLRTVAGVCGKRGYDGDGGSATRALLDRPYGIELTPEGQLYIADTYNNRIRLVRL